MKSPRVTQAKQVGAPATAGGEIGGLAQRKLAGTPRQADEAAHIAQLKGETKPKGKMPPPKKGKGK
ncbi:MAG: hypothetical protein EPN68_11745 [Rhodanobacter sp.]|nr:MAG: hypothetical protein EPN68_11745 [Rhodanobacter sp.]